MTHAASAALNFLELFRLSERRVLVTCEMPGFDHQLMQVISVLDPGEYDEPLARVTFAADAIGMDDPKHLTLEVFSAERLAEFPGISLHIGFGITVNVALLPNPTPTDAQIKEILDIL
jgi:hypothetical protein